MREAVIALAGTAVGLGAVLSYQPVFGAEDTDAVSAQSENPTSVDGGATSGTATNAAPAPSTTPSPSTSGTPTPTKTSPRTTAAAGSDAWKAVASDDSAEGEWFTGAVFPVQWGDVQVKAKLEGKRITDVQALSLPDGDAYSADLSKKVATTLRAEVLQAQSADVDMVSGATYSSQAYLKSLQSALDKAEGTSTKVTTTRATTSTTRPTTTSSRPTTKSSSAPSTTSPRSATEPVSVPTPTTPTVPAAVGEATWVTGDVVPVVWGDWQVKVRLDGSRIVDVQAVTQPTSDEYTVSLSEQVVSTLGPQVIERQSTSVDMISGATFSSQAYLTSLQSALDRAAATTPATGSASVPVVTTTAAPVVTSAPAPRPSVTVTSVSPTPVLTSFAVPAEARWVEGEVFPVQWGDVQVKVQLQGTTILDVQTLSMPDGDAYSKSLSAQVATTLRTEVLQAQSADVDMVSGATYSSQAYLTSLQSALDKAGVETTSTPVFSPTPTGGVATTTRPALTGTDRIVTANPAFTG